ncbi:MAG TPA: PRTRC system protein C [Candidatus Angelobacter sp.]|nr:PRTRC system protein C [Candidatus Angelobacter sp.]
MKVNALRRRFVFNGMELPDPGNTLTVEEVQEMYTTAYPELSTAAVKGPSPVNGAMEYTFTREVGVKG